MRLKLLGVFDARLPDGRTAEIGTRKAQALLAILACRPGEPYARDRLAAMLWGDGDDRAARHSLRQALASLRRTLPTGALAETNRGSVGIDPAALDVDVVAFERLGRSGGVAELTAAVQLYRGPFLDGFGLREDPFEEWLAQERSRLHECAMAFTLRLAELTTDAKQAAESLRRALELDPLCEEAHRGLMRRALTSGARNVAIRQYNLCVEALQRELGVTPEPQTEALYQEVLAARGAKEASRIDGARSGEPAGERKQVTVLCGTLVPRSPGDALGDPERAQELLGEVLGELRSIALRSGGNVVGETGDEIITVFGAPVARENHAADACRAASEMAMAARERPGLAFRLSIAIDSGEAVVRTRDRSLSAAGVFGECLQRAARLARSGSVPIGATEATFALANRFWRFTPIDVAPLDSRAPPLRLYAPVGPWPGSSGLDHFPAHLRSRFVGRSEELAALHGALAPAAAGSGRLIAVVGEPGIGKSRLFHEFIRGVPREWRVVVCRGDPQLADAPYRPIARAVGTCLGIDDERRPEHSAAGVGRAARTLDPQLERYSAALASLLEVGAADASWEALEPARKRQQLIDAATQVFLRAAKRRPLLLVIEDLHWLDTASRQVLERLVELVPAARILLMVNYRPEFTHAWGSRSFYRQIAVGPLSASTMTDFARALLGNDVSVTALGERLVASTGGNPFFIEECVRSLTHSGALAGSAGAFRAERELADLTLPETVQAVIAARIDQLAASDKALLRVAAAIGNDVPYDVLRAVSALDEEALHAALGRLQAAEFLIEAAASSAATYRFKHALTNEVAYATLLLQARRELHARILTVLEHQHAGRLDEHVEALAYHSGRGDVLERAVDYGRRAGLKAVARAAYRVAVAHFGQALGALRRLPETQLRLTEEIDLCFELRNSLFVLGEHGLIMEHLRRAEALAERTNDALRCGYSALQIGGWFWYDGQQRSSRSAAERALDIALNAGDLDLTALAWYRIAQSHHASGEYRTAIDAYLRSTSMLENAGRTEIVAFGGYPYAFCCSFLSWSFAELGDFAAAREWGLRGWHFATQRNHSYTQSVTTFGLGLCYVREDRLDDACAILEKGLELCAVGDVPTTFSWVASPLGYLYVAGGRHEAGFDLLHRALTSGPPTLHRARLELWLADACVLAGRNEEALQAARRAKVFAQQHGERAHVAWAERVLGDLAAGEDPTGAQLHYASAIQIARPLELVSIMAGALAGQARLSSAQEIVRAGTRLPMRGRASVAPNEAASG